jgi:hypothetical protein
MNNVTRILFAAVAVAGIGSISPAMAASGPSARLVSCGGESCLLVTGRRDDAAAAVSINDHAVPVEGGRSWRARLPLSSVRLWAEPYARSISVTVAGSDSRAEARLPIGLLGHVTNLASLVVSAH